MRMNAVTRTTLIPAGLLLLGAALLLPAPAAAQGCGLHYVAAGDAITAGKEVTESERYPNQLVERHLKTWGAWCLYDIAKDETTSQTYITGGQLAQTWNYRPDLITLTVGEQNNTIKDVVGSCFDKVKSHDFAGANACAGAILGNTTLYSNLTSNLTTTFQQYRMIMSGRPNLVVAVLGYPNPYPKSLDASAKIAELCAPLIDTIPTCTARWVQLPPALELIDQVFKKLNKTIEDAVKPFAIGSAGRFVYVNTYDKLRDHCMKMEVSFKTTVEHPEESGAVHEHDSPYAVNFGCSENWFVEGDDGTDSPFYLNPAAIGVLTKYSQKTENMGVWPNADAHKCLADLIWEADTLDPGTTPLKWKLRVPEPPKTDICQ
ncbi:MAG TPA: hypothetical protein VGF40_11850 [Thermoanaerobaculia bacterium]